MRDRGHRENSIREYVSRSMDFITVYFIVMVVATIVLAPVFGAESRRSFLRPDERLRAGWAPARPWDLRH